MLVLALAAALAQALVPALGALAGRRAWQAVATALAATQVGPAAARRAPPLMRPPSALLLRHVA